MSEGMGGDVTPDDAISHFKRLNRLPFGILPARASVIRQNLLDLSLVRHNGPICHRQSVPFIRGGASPASSMIELFLHLLCRYLLRLELQDCLAGSDRDLSVLQRHWSPLCMDWGVFTVDGDPHEPMRDEL
jgi:hypothetical protein